MPDEFAGLLSHMAIISDTNMDALLSDDRNTMEECLNEILKDIVVKEIEKSTASPLRPSQILINYKRNSAALASIRPLIFDEGFIEA